MIKDQDGLYKKISTDREHVEGVVKGLTFDLCKLAIIVFIILVVVMPFLSMMVGPAESIYYRYKTIIGAAKGEPQNCPEVDQKLCLSFIPNVTCPPQVCLPQSCKPQACPPQNACPNKITSEDISNCNACSLCEKCLSQI
jgi:hypothetical protein